MRGQRLLTCLLASLTLHTAFLAFIPPLLSHSPSSLKTPLWVDLVDIKEPSPPASSVPHPGLSFEAPSEKPERRPAVPALEPPPRRQEAPHASVPPRRPLPPARDLIPTMNTLLSLQHTYNDPLHVESSGDSGEGMHRGPQYDAYLREIRDAVRKHWKVSGDGDSKRGTTVLRLSIGQDGSLASLDLLQSSGMVLHDYEALEAIKGSFPIRHPPKSLLDAHGRLSIRFSFHYLLAPPG